MSIGLQYYLLAIGSILIIFIMPFIFFKAAKMFQRGIEYIIDLINLKHVKSHIHNICNALIEFSQMAPSRKLKIISTLGPQAAVKSLTRTEARSSSEVPLGSRSQ